MTVRELIEALSNFPDNMPVVWIIPSGEGIGESQEIYELQWSDDRNEIVVNGYS